MSFFDWLAKWLYPKAKKAERIAPEPVVVFNKPSRIVRRVFLHCSASDSPFLDDVEVIRKDHIYNNGWSDIGYHYYITKDGTIQTGRPLDKRPAAQKGHNKATIAICLHGLEHFTEAQFASLRALCRAIALAYHGDVTFHGHCEVSNKECPVFEYAKVLGLSGNGRMLQL